MIKEKTEMDEIEEGLTLRLNFDDRGLIPVIVQDYESGRNLMFAYVNQEALEITMKKKLATFWSRKREEIWTKGLSSGNTLKVKEVRLDCDQDTLIYIVEKNLGGACHTKEAGGEYRTSCFYRRLKDNFSLEYI